MNIFYGKQMQQGQCSDRIPPHAESGANRNLEVTTKPEVLQASLRRNNLQDNIEKIKNIMWK